MTDEKKIEILYDHYKDTFVNQKDYLQKRNYYTLISIALIALLSFQMSNPDQSSVISNEVIRRNIGDIKIDFGYINSVLTFALLWIVLMYYQINFQIERMYKYLHSIEEKLTLELKPFEISREGKTYIDHYPILSKVVHRIYSIGFPVTLVCVSIFKWVTEMKQFTAPFINGHFWFDTIVLFVIMLTSLLYLMNIHFNDFRTKKKI